MPDITMCPGNDCSIKESCYRFTASPSEFAQAYFRKSPIADGATECKYYWKHDR
jgi:hypothetical protein|tara:strand:+ start:339 stop:500 length:162 start_codon:yes stop_codon:yes gene_type:complete